METWKNHKLFQTTNQLNNHKSRQHVSTNLTWFAHWFGCDCWVQVRKWCFFPSSPGVVVTVSDVSDLGETQYRKHSLGEFAESPVILYTSILCISDKPWQTRCWTRRKQVSSLWLSLLINDHPTLIIGWSSPFPYCHIFLIRKSCTKIWWKNRNHPTVRFRAPAAQRGPVQAT